MQIFDITVPANSSFVVHAPGKYIKYISGNNGGGDTRLTITPGMHASSKITLSPGQAYRVSAEGQKPDSWTLANYANGATILGQVVVGDGQIDDTSIAGTVQVVDGGKARSLNGSAFFGYNSAAPVAAQYCTLQLFNPAAATTRAVVEQITVYSAGASALRLWWNAAQLPTLGGYQPQAKLLGSATSNARCYTDSPAVPDFIGAQGLTNFSVLGSTPQVIRFSEPLVLRPGYGVCIDTNVVNNQIGANFEFFEEPNV